MIDPLLLAAIKATRDRWACIAMDNDGYVTDCCVDIYCPLCTYIYQTCLNSELSIGPWICPKCPVFVYINEKWRVDDLALCCCVGDRVIDLNTTRPMLDMLDALVYMLYLEDK